MATPKRFELSIAWFVARCLVRFGYGAVVVPERLELSLAAPKAAVLTDYTTGLSCVLLLRTSDVMNLAVQTSNGGNNSRTHEGLSMAISTDELTIGKFLINSLLTPPPVGDSADENRLTSFMVEIETTPIILAACDTGALNLDFS